MPASGPFRLMWMLIVPDLTMCRKRKPAAGAETKQYLSPRVIRNRHFSETSCVRGDPLVLASDRLPSSLLCVFPLVLFIPFLVGPPLLYQYSTDLIGGRLVNGLDVILALALARGERGGETEDGRSEERRVGKGGRDG